MSRRIGRFVREVPGRRSDRVPPRSAVPLRVLFASAVGLAVVASVVGLAVGAAPAANPDAPSGKSAGPTSSSTTTTSTSTSKTTTSKTTTSTGSSSSSSTAKPADPPKSSGPFDPRPSTKRPLLGFDSPPFAALPPDPGPGHPVSFILMGDQHFKPSGDSVKFFELFVKRFPTLPHFDFIVTLGDQINNGGNYREWLEYGTHPAPKAWFAAMKKAGRPIFPMAGNHEVGKTRTVSTAEKTLSGEDREIERLISAVTPADKVAERIEFYRALRKDLSRSPLNTSRPDWGKFFQAHFYEELFTANAARIDHAPTPDKAEEFWYAFRHAGCQFVFLDGNHNTRSNFASAEKRTSVGLRQYRFLEDTLQRAKADGIARIFVFVHQPLFVSDSTHEADARDQRGVRYPVGRELTVPERLKLLAEARAAEKKDSKPAEKKDGKTDPKAAPKSDAKAAEPALPDPKSPDGKLMEGIRDRELVHFADLLRKYEVTAVIHGHVHRYERFVWDQGNGRRVPCIITGGSSASRGRPALNPDPEVLTVDHIQRSRKGTGARVDILQAAAGQMVHQVYPRTPLQAFELADKKLFVLHVKVDGGKVALTLIPLEELRRDGKPAPHYEHVDDLLTEPLPKPEKPTPLEFHPHVVATGGHPSFAVVMRDTPTVAAGVETPGAGGAESPAPADPKTPDKPVDPGPAQPKSDPPAPAPKADPALPAPGGDKPAGDKPSGDKPAGDRPEPARGERRRLLIVGDHCGIVTAREWGTPPGRALWRQEAGELSALLAGDPDRNGRVDVVLGRPNGVNGAGWTMWPNVGNESSLQAPVLLDAGVDAPCPQAALWLDVDDDDVPELLVGDFRTGIVRVIDRPENQREGDGHPREDLWKPEGFDPDKAEEPWGLRAMAILPNPKEEDDNGPVVQPGGKRHHRPPPSIIVASCRSKDSVILLEAVPAKDDGDEPKPDEKPEGAAAGEGAAGGEPAGGKRPRWTWKRTVLETGSGDPSGLVVADFNGDGLPDIAVLDRGVEHASNKGVWLLTQGRDKDGKTVWAKSTVDKNLAPASGAAGDLDGDGFTDLVVTHRDAKSRKHSVVMLRNRGGSFDNRKLGDLGKEGTRAGDAGTVQIVDLNDDGRPDILVAGGITGTIVWFRNGK